MARIKIKDLPKNAKISKDEMKKVIGGLSLSPSSLYGRSSTLSATDTINTFNINQLTSPFSAKIDCW